MRVGVVAAGAAVAVGEEAAVELEDDDGDDAEADEEAAGAFAVQAEPDKKPTAVDTAPVFELRESRSRAWFS